jgi:nicotinamide-nucleotide amidase
MRPAVPDGGTRSDRTARTEVVTSIARHLAGRSLACAESCTAGRLGTAFAGATDASDWFRGGLVAYQLEVKRSLLSVEAASMFSERAASEMAVGVAQLLTADVTIATTGVAGDRPEDGVAPGTVFIAVQVDGDVEVRCFSYHKYVGDATAICDHATDDSLVMLLDRLVGGDRRSRRSDLEMGGRQ